MKEGNKYEDLALMGAIRQLIVHIDAAQGKTDRPAHCVGYFKIGVSDELGPLLAALVRLKMSELGEKVQQVFCSLVASARSVLTDVWPMHWQAHLLPGPLEELVIEIFSFLYSIISFLVQGRRRYCSFSNGRLNARSSCYW